MSNTLIVAALSGLFLGTDVKAATAKAEPDATARDDAQQLAGRIDEAIAAKWRAAGLTPAGLADDPTFLRRASLDLAGRIPAAAEVRRFLADRAANKRRQAIDRLLQSPGYVSQQTNIWVGLLLPLEGNDFQERFLVTGMESWLRNQFAENISYDRMVRELLTVAMPSSGNRRGPEPLPSVRQSASPLAFYQAKQGKPEELAAGMTRLFLGVRLECAQCHNHPFARWTREQFWNQAAFFAGIRSRGDIFGPLSEIADRRELLIPGTSRVAQARFLDGGEPRWKFKVGARTTLADWVTAKNNPYFARAAVNRLWSQFFGVGLIEPVDDFRDDNPPSHPELLDELARQFVDHGFDYQYIIKAIALSKTYQLGSRYDGPAPDPRLFARMPVRGLTPEQLYASFVQATGYRDPYPANQRRFIPNSFQNQFRSRFRAQQKPAEYQVALTQALLMMNHKDIADLTHPDRGETLAAVVHAPFMTETDKIEALYLAALSRPPRPEESSRMRLLVERNANRGQALADVFWSLLNSSEFMFNH